MGIEDVKAGAPLRGTRALVVENDPSNDARRLGDWLRGGGLDLVVVRPYAGAAAEPAEPTLAGAPGGTAGAAAEPAEPTLAGAPGIAAGGTGLAGSASADAPTFAGDTLPNDTLPDDLDGYAALVVLGGVQDAFVDVDGNPGAPWFAHLEGLLRKATRHTVPTLAICLGGQLLATAHGGMVQRSPSGPEIGPRLVARRDAADRDPVFAGVPFAPDVIQWHRDEITELPSGAVLLAASTHCPVQAFRIGPAAWGTQFHIECDTEMFAEWAIDDIATLGELGIDGVELVASVDAVLDDVAEVWKPFAERFAAVALGRLPVGEAESRFLPLLGGGLG